MSPGQNPLSETRSHISLAGRQLPEVHRRGKHKSLWRNNMPRSRVLPHNIRSTGQGVSLDVFLCRAKMDSEVKARKEEGPPGLTRIQTLSRLRVLKVFVVRENADWKSGSLQQMTPLFQSQLDG
ncbi:hypothetical protein GDO81_022107 [Engystomops pustulosus]|uniref:Uncharacterized protein n=1 Tax=Engystomops pustulosus TaxID=76066 RepID=A0AAV6YYB5_ENGPU|nr:hypothetical protein GDO81_022107 [Engystomops pustulosus]